MGGPICSGSSSEEEDSNWKAAIESIAATTTFGNNTTSSKSLHISNRDGEELNQNSQKLKHYQLKAQKLLDDILEKSLVVVSEPIHVLDNHTANEGGVRLFKNSPAGIVFDHKDVIQGPKKRPRIIPRYNLDEKSKEFRRQIKSVAVDGTDIIAAAKEGCQKALARLESKEAAAKAKAKKEEERIAELKRTRGERWLPSIAKEMQSFQPT